MTISVEERERWEALADVIEVWGVSDTGEPLGAVPDSTSHNLWIGVMARAVPRLCAALAEAETRIAELEESEITIEAEVERLRGALAAADDLIDRIIRDEHVVDLGFEAWGPMDESTRAEGRALLAAYDAIRSGEIADV